MPTFLINPAQIHQETVAIDGPVGHHLARVHRTRIGDALTLTDGCGTRYDATAATIGRADLTATIRARHTVAPPALRITLAAAIIAPDRWKLTLEKATELGVHTIVPLITERTQGRDYAGKLDRWTDIIAASATQCDNVWWPHISAPQPFAAAVAAPHEQSTSYLAWEDARAEHCPQLGTPPCNTPHAILYIGPTGGWSPTEIATARASGVHLAHLGPHTLRAETAATVALTLLQAARW